MKLTKHLKSVFWDVDAKQLNKARHRGFIISRVAEKGSWNDLLWLKKAYSKTAIKNTVLRSHNVSAKTKALWKVI
jgi:hypothetical protein